MVRKNKVKVKTPKNNKWISYEEWKAQQKWTQERERKLFPIAALLFNI